MAGKKRVFHLFGWLVTIAQLQAPGLCAQGQEKPNPQGNVPRHIPCVPQTSVESCPKQDVYRDINGACNNRENPSLGASNTALARWLPAEYEDGVSQPQGWTEGKLYKGHSLPLVREISNKIVRSVTGVTTVDEERSQLFMSWGQWTTHDMVFSPLGLLDCTPNNTCGTLCVNDEATNCFPIKMPPNDPRDEGRRKCMAFPRTAPVCGSKTMVRESVNAVTSFIDASAVYGSEKCRADMLKDATSGLGLLAVNKRFTDGSQVYMPFDDETVDLCPPTVFCLLKDPCPLRNTTYNIPCFIAGDKRANQNLPFLTLNTLFVREHNRLARELKRLNPRWDGERLYQEARKIIGALVQVFTYRDYLPIVLGEWVDIELPPYKKYNEHVDPRISNVFLIAFRYAHTSIPPYTFRLDQQYKPFYPDYKIPFHQGLFATWRIVKEGGIDPLVRGLLVNSAKLMKQNEMMSDEVRERLFESPKLPGVDLAAIDLQRGRDIGLPSYNSWRKFCGLTVPSNLVELAAVLKNEDLAKKLLDMYGTPDNIDLWIGAVAEPFVKNARVGPLLGCLIGSQFRKIRDGDRFWWQNPNAFTPQQIAALSRSSLSGVICDNTALTEVPRNVFLANEYPEDFTSCKTINKLDLSAWVEAKGQKGKQHSEL